MSVQLAVGCELLQTPSLLHQLLQELSLTSKSIAIKEQLCECDSHQLSYAKLKMVSAKQNSNNLLYSIKIWVEGDRPSPLLLKGQLFNVIVCENCNTSIDLGDNKSTIIITQMHEIRELLGLSVFQLDKRCKLEYKLRKSHQRYEMAHKKEKLKELALAYSTLKCTQQLKSFLNFMRFNTRTYLRITRKCFTLWLIHRYEQGLQKLNEEIVDSNPMQTVSLRRLMERCFDGWKKSVQRNA